MRAWCEPLAPRVVEVAPADVKLLPIVDPVLADGRDRDPVRPTPAQAEQILRGDGNTHGDLGTPGHQQSITLWVQSVGSANSLGAGDQSGS